MTNSKCSVTPASISHGSLFSACIPATEIAATNMSKFIGILCLVTVLTHYPDLQYAGGSCYLIEPKPGHLVNPSAEQEKVNLGVMMAGECGHTE